jgi:hypothetical protein
MWDVLMVLTTTGRGWVVAVRRLLLCFHVISDPSIARVVSDNLFPSIFFRAAEDAPVVLKMLLCCCPGSAPAACAG